MDNIDNVSNVNTAAPGSRKAGRRAMWLAVAASVVVFAVSAILAGANASGYERLKNAFFLMLESGFERQDSGTYTIGQTVYVDGAVAVSYRNVEKWNPSQELSFDTNYESEVWGTLYRRPSFGGSYGSEAAYPKTSERLTYRDNSNWYEWNNGVFADRSRWVTPSMFETKTYDGDADDDAYGAENDTTATMRLVGAVMDALVGDTRNYFISEDDRVSITLSDGQIPELAQYALAAMTEQANNLNRNMYRYEQLALADKEGGAASAGAGVIGSSDGAPGANPSANDLIGADARFTYAALEAVLDDAGAVTKADVEIVMTATVNGAPKEFKLVLTFESGVADASGFDAPAAGDYAPTGELPAKAG